MNLQNMSDEELEQLQMLLQYGGKSSSAIPATSSASDGTASTLDTAGNATMAINPYVGVGLKAAGLGMQVMGANAADKQADKDRAEERRRYNYNLDRNRMAGFLGLRRARLGERMESGDRNRQSIIDLLSQYNRTHGST